jgi:hypothetical protein
LFSWTGFYRKYLQDFIVNIYRILSVNIWILSYLDFISIWILSGFYIGFFSDYSLKGRAIGKSENEAEIEAAKIVLPGVYELSKRLSDVPTTLNTKFVLGLIGPMKLYKLGAYNSD